MTPEADKIVLLLGEAIASDSGVSEDWRRIVAVFTIQPGVVGGWAKCARNDGKLQNIWLEDGKEIPLVERLHAVTQVEEKASWVACKVTIERDGLKMNIQFEYADPKRWDEPLPF